MPIMRHLLLNDKGANKGGAAADKQADSAELNELKEKLRKLEEEH